MIRNPPYFQVRLIPGMNFTCNGTITGMTVVGEKQSNGGQRMKLSVWRENESGFYCKAEEFFLSPDKCNKVENYSKVFNCQLPVNMKVSVGPGDILGIELPHQNLANFELYSVPESGLTNYIFYGRNHNFFHAIDLSMHTGRTLATSNTQPLIIMRVDRGMYIIIILLHLKQP